MTSAFGAKCLLVKYLNLLARTLTKHHERIGNITALSGNNPEVRSGEIASEKRIKALIIQLHNFYAVKMCIAQNSSM